ncbi:MAG TPA: efflux RND transporter periplasmic adaptor subunit [Humisphaera sp.]|jgi:multidrug efflux pump subunit AcrA (membrane-fusion protein)|nr:efflux RND transporter periplasmic adaptor subunit [Humisphaera sp.]
MKSWINVTIFAAIIVLLAIGWIFYFHNDAIVEHLHKDGKLAKIVKKLGQSTPPVVPEDEDPDNTKNEIPVHVAHLQTAKLHRYIDGFGTVSPKPAGPGQMAGSANIASPIAGVVAKVLRTVGQQVHAGDPVIQLDDRLARSAVEQAEAGLTQAQASLAALKAEPRPDQVQIAQLTVEKSQSALELAQKNYDRIKLLASQQGASGKSVEQAASDLAGARLDLAISQKQLALLNAAPLPEQLRQEQAKVAQAAAALATAKVQLQMMTITAPIDASVVSVSANPGESVDPTHPLIQLVALDRLMVDVDVPAEQLPANAAGLAARIFPSSASFTDDQNKLAEGKVTMVTPQVDARNGAVMVGIDLPADANLRPGLAVKVRIVVEEHKDVVAAPQEAVVTDENGDSVISVVEENQATHKTVKVGLQENGLTEVIGEGLSDSTVVVTTGAYGLPAATRVRIVE